LSIKRRRSPNPSRKGRIETPARQEQLSPVWRSFSTEPQRHRAHVSQMRAAALVAIR
jgi:hypothetical protein